LGLRCFLSPDPKTRDEGMVRKNRLPQTKPHDIRRIKSAKHSKG